MGKTTAISWCDATFNPWIGCTKVSQGCTHCYAEAQNKRYNWAPDGWGKGKARRLTSASNWMKPYEWAKQAVKDGVTRRVFCASLADVFDSEVPGEWRQSLFDMIDFIGQKYSGLEWLILTKRHENLASMLPPEWIDNPPDYVRLGVTAEDQENADKRIPELLKVWHGKNFISVEPMLGNMNLNDYLGSEVIIDWDKGTYQDYMSNNSIDTPIYGKGVDWIIVGGESGAGCRPMDIAWAQGLRFQCQDNGTPYFFKQMGGFPDKRDDPAGWPSDLQVREFPE